MSVERVEISLLWVWLATLTFVAVLLTSPAFAAPRMLFENPKNSEEAYQAQTIYLTHASLYARCPDLYKDVPGEKFKELAQVNARKMRSFYAAEPAKNGKPKVSDAELAKRLIMVRDRSDSSIDSLLGSAQGNCEKLAEFKNGLAMPSFN